MAVNGFPEMNKEKIQRSNGGGFLACVFLYMFAFLLLDSNDEICMWIIGACRCIDTKLLVNLMIWHILLKCGTSLITWRCIIWHRFRWNGFTWQHFESSWYQFDLLSVLRAEHGDGGNTLATVMLRNDTFLTTSASVSSAKHVNLLAICDSEEFSSEIQEDLQGNENAALTNRQDNPPGNETVGATLLSRNIDKTTDVNSPGPSTTPLRHDKVYHEEKEIHIIPIFEEWVETTEPKTLEGKEKGKLTDGKAKRIRHKSCRKRSLDETVRTSSTGNAKAWLSFTGTCLSLVTTPKKLAHVLTLMVCISSIQYVDTAVPQLQSDEPIFKYPILMTPQCNDVELMKRSQCSADDYTGSIYMEMCGFPQLCSQGTKPFCLTTERGMTHICMPENIFCPKGYKRQFWVEESDMLHVRAKDVKCPLGTYQPTVSPCNDACQYTHRDLSSLGNQYVVYSIGDHVSPANVYCNYRRGFYNPYGKFLIDIDADDSNACIHTSIYNPCVRDQTPLPNGTCVNPCAKGSCRDDHDGFHCKMKHRDTDCDDIEGGLETLVVVPKVNNINENFYPPPTQTTGIMSAEDENQPMESLEYYKIAITVLIAVTITISVVSLLALVLFKDEDDGKMTPVERWI